MACNLWLCGCLQPRDFYCHLVAESRWGVSERTHCFASAAGPSCTVSPWVQELGFPTKFLIEPLLIPLVSSRIPPSLVLQHATASSGKEVMLRAPREAKFFNFRVDWFQHTKTSKMKILGPCPWPRVLQSLYILEPLLNCRSIIYCRHLSRLMQNPWSRSLHPLMSSNSVKVCAAFRSYVQSIVKQIASASLVCLVEKRLETSGRGKRRARTCVMPGCCHSNDQVATKGLRTKAEFRIII